MAYRTTVSNLFLKRVNRPFFTIRTKATQTEELHAGNVGKGHELYSPKLLKKHKEIMPLLVIVLGGIGVLSGFIFRNTLTRDDVRFRKQGKFGFEKEENFDKQRKFMVYNQTYKAPEGLKELYEELKEAK